VGPRAVLDMVVKRKIPWPRWESNRRTSIVQPVAQSLYRLTYHGCAEWNCCNKSVEVLYECPNLSAHADYKIIEQPVSERGPLHETSAYCVRAVEMQSALCTEQEVASLRLAG
jgi:hypothetical protein